MTMGLRKKLRKRIRQKKWRGWRNGIVKSKEYMREEEEMYLKIKRKRNMIKIQGERVGEERGQCISHNYEKRKKTVFKEMRHAPTCTIVVGLMITLQEAGPSRSCTLVVHSVKT
jgi:hypothetical protein